MKKIVPLIGMLTSIAFVFTECKKEAPRPAASFNYSGAGIAPATIAFTNTSSNATTYLWDFGDNGTSTQADPTHTYMQGGVYTVTLTVTGGGGSNSITKTVNIQTPTSVKITKLKVAAMPFIDPGCNCGWDANSAPDVYFQLTNNSNVVLVDGKGSTISDATQTMLPLSWVFTSPFQVTNFATTYKILVYDNDTNDFPPNTDDFIGGYSFSFSQFASNGYPATVTLQIPASQLEIDLSLQWQ